MKLDLHTYVLMQMLDGVPTVFATMQTGQHLKHQA